MATKRYNINVYETIHSQIIIIVVVVAVDDDDFVSLCRYSCLLEETILTLV